MYDAREKAIRDQQWAMKASFREGKIEGKIEEKIEHIRMLQSILGVTVGEEHELQNMNVEQLTSLTGSLQEKIRNRLWS